MTKRTSHSYYVVMEDLGRLGLEANVSPEITRSGVVEFIKNGNYRNIVFIHHIDGLFIEDVTAELIDEAECQGNPEKWVDRQAEAFDRARDYRKHEVA